MFKCLKNPVAWLHGLLSAFIGGGAGVAGLGLWDPKTFNIHEGLPKMVEAFCAIGLPAALAYLKKSPLPDLVETVTQTVTQTVTKETTGGLTAENAENTKKENK